MTNEQFKEIYDNSLYHAWVTSKDATKAAEQKRKQQEYNRKYYQNNKDKWHKETESQGLGTGSGTYRFRDERDRKENASAIARQAAGDIKRQQEEAAARERWEEKQRQKNVRDLAQNARRELGTQNLKSNEAKGMEASARARRNRRVSENRRATESEQMTKTRQQQNTRNKVKQKQSKESNVREDTFRTSSQRRKTGAAAQRLADSKKATQRARANVSEQYVANAKKRRVNEFKKSKASNEAAAYVNARNERRATRHRNEISYDRRNRSFQEGRAYKENRQAERRKRARKSPVQNMYREFKGIQIRDRRPSDNASRAEQASRNATSLNRKLKKKMVI